MGASHDWPSEGSDQRIVCPDRRDSWRDNGSHGIRFMFSLP